MKDLTNFTHALLRELHDEGRFGTEHVYQSTLRAFARYWKTRCTQSTIPLETVFTAPTLAAFEKYLRGCGLQMNTLSTYLRMLRALYYRALKRGYVTYVAGLFDHVYTGTRADIKRALTPADMGKVLHTAHTPEDVPPSQMQRWFVLQFLLRGMPFADLARLRKCDLQNGVITYCRQKTGRTLSIRLTKQTAELIRCCADHNPQSPYLLNILWNDDAPAQAPIGSNQEYKRYQQVLRSFNRQLKKLSVALSIHYNLSSYVARHTWATIAYHKNYATGIISTALGHSSIAVTETYLKPFEQEELDKMNREIICYTETCAKME